jgi:hypothetical protein
MWSVRFRNPGTGPRRCPSRPSITSGISDCHGIRGVPRWAVVNPAEPSLSSTCTASRRTSAQFGHRPLESLPGTDLDHVQQPGGAVPSRRPGPCRPRCCARMVPVLTGEVSRGGVPGGGVASRPRSRQRRAMSTRGSTLCRRAAGHGLGTSSTPAPRTCVDEWTSTEQIATAGAGTPRPSRRRLPVAGTCAGLKSRLGRANNLPGISATTGQMPPRPAAGPVNAGSPAFRRRERGHLVIDRGGQ